MALRRSVLQEDDILFDLYADSRSDVSDNSDNERLDSDSDVPQLVHVNNCDLLLGPLPPKIFTTIFPHTYQDSFYNTVRLAQTLLAKNVRVCGTMRAN